MQVLVEREEDWFSTADLVEDPAGSETDLDLLVNEADGPRAARR